MKTIRCIICSAEFADGEVVGNACPACGISALPVQISQDVTVRINWHELRILTIWATNYSIHAGFDLPDTLPLRAIIDRLMAQRPEGFAALTLAMERDELAERLGQDVVVHDPLKKVSN